MKYGKLLGMLMEQMPEDYRDKFLSYKQLKKVINTILQDNSVPTAAFVELPGAGVAVEEEEEEEDVPSVEAITARDVEVAWQMGRGGEPVAKRARAEEGMAVGGQGAGGGGEGGEGGELKVEVGTKRKVGGGQVGGGRDEGANVATVAIPGEVLAAWKIAVRARHGEEKELTKEEEDFLQLLNVELEKFNSFFTEKEEFYVIRLQELKNRLEMLREINGPDEDHEYMYDDLLEIRRGLVTLHGEVVLMESYSTLNYTGLVKILKKHDKRTGAVLRLPFIRRVLLQPFFSTEVLSQLVQECENCLSTFSPPPSKESIEVEPVDGAGGAQSEARKPSYSSAHDTGGILKSTVAALRTIQEMRKGSSTVSAQSLPPCNLSGNHERFGMVVNDETWNRKLSELSRKQEPESTTCAS